jgi:hypothetical protein
VRDLRRRRAAIHPEDLLSGPAGHLAQLGRQVPDPLSGRVAAAFEFVELQNGVE